MDRVARPCLNLAGFKTRILAGFCSADYNMNHRQLVLSQKTPDYEVHFVVG